MMHGKTTHGLWMHTYVFLICLSHTENQGNQGIKENVPFPQKEAVSFNK